ncbi:hypothetical protein [Streptomyces sp. NPDC003514]
MAWQDERDTKQEKGYLPMQWLRKLTTTIAVASAVIFGSTSQAEASTNSGWVYTFGQSGAIYFDADLNGHPGWEKITVCDNKSDGRGIVGEVDSSVNIQYGVQVADPSNNGTCSSKAGDFFDEEEVVGLWVCEYHDGANNPLNWEHCNSISANGSLRA